MHLIQAIRTAIETLGANPLRTTLSTLGVIIGVASLVAILALADGLEGYTREQIAQTTDLQGIVVTPRTFEVRDGIRVARERVLDVSVEDVAALEERLRGRADATLALVGSGRMRLGGDTAQRAVLVAGVLPTAEAAGPESLVAGRYVTMADVGGDARVVVVPSSLGGEVGVEASALPGRALELDGSPYRIVGVVEDESAAMRLRVPLSARARGALERPDRRAQLVVRARRVEGVEPVREEVESFLSERFAEAGGAAAFTVASNRSRTQQARQGLLIFRLVMGAIAGISLLVGGIGIMNILLASVFERTREIGVRRATGARARDIRRQLLAESVVISGLGSLLGVVMGLSGAYVITAGIRRLTETEIYAGFTWTSVLVAGGAALVVGLVFGTYPARRAARLSPIEAIRHE